MMGQALDFVIQLAKMSVNQQKDNGFDTDEIYKLYVERALMPIFELSAGEDTQMESILKDFQSQIVLKNFTAPTFTNLTDEI